MLADLTKVYESKGLEGISDVLSDLDLSVMQIPELSSVFWYVKPLETKLESADLAGWGVFVFRLYSMDNGVTLQQFEKEYLVRNTGTQD